VRIVTVRSIWAEPKHVTCADLLGSALVVVRIHTVVLAQFAEATMVVRARFMLFGRNSFIRFWMPVDAALFLVAVAVLGNELANWHLVFLI